MISEVSAVHGVGVRQPGVHDPLDEFLVRAVDLCRQRDPHALHQRPARDEPARVGVRAGHPRRQHLQRPQLLMCHLAVGPLAPRQRAHRQPHLAFAGAHQHRLEDLREHHRIVEGVVRLHLRDAPVRGKCLQPQVLGTQLESAGQFDGAHGGVDGQFRVDHLGLGGQERVVEPDVVGHQGAAPEQSIRSPTMSPKRGWPSSISAVNPWTWVGPGSTPGLSSV